MTDLFPQAEGFVATTTDESERFFDPADNPPYRMKWQDMADSGLAARFKHALTRLEGLMYAVWGSIPLYSQHKQWYERDNPRVLWGCEQLWFTQENFQIPPNCEAGLATHWDETSALGESHSGLGAQVPIRSRSGDPRAQFQRAQHHAYFPLGSVERVDGEGFPHDPAAIKNAPRWPAPQRVRIRWTVPPGVPAINPAWPPRVVSLGAGTSVSNMTEVSPGVWEYEFPELPHDTWVAWYIWLLLFDQEAPNNSVFEPYAGIDVDGSHINPTPREDIGDPDHDYETGLSYSFCQFSHYNPYANGLPEMLPQCKKGTDEYRFTPDEAIQPALINLCRFVLDGLGRLFEHNPRSRDCCFPMPIAFRWSGANRPDLYETGGKGGTSSVEPLSNLPSQDNLGDGYARRTWRGIPMAWLNAEDSPGYFLNNIYFGDTESWLTPPPELPLDVDPLFPINCALMRRYDKRGLRPGDAIDPVHIEEIIAAVNYLCDGGCWLTRPVQTFKQTVHSMWGKPCGYCYEEYCTDSPPPLHMAVKQGNSISGCGLDCTNYGYPNGSPECECKFGSKCCRNAPGCAGGCLPWERPNSLDCLCAQDPAHPSCIGYVKPPEIGSGKCSALRYRIDKTGNYSSPYIGCYGTGLQPCGVTHGEHVHCGHNFSEVADGGAVIGRHSWSKGCTGPDDEVFGCGSRITTGAAYFVCGPARTWSGPDSTHGNGITKDRHNNNGDWRSYPKNMGNYLGEIESCKSPAPGQPLTIGFGSIVGVIDEGFANNWWSQQTGFGQKYDYLKAPGLGVWTDLYSHTDTLTHPGYQPCGEPDYIEAAGFNWGYDVWHDKVSYANYPVCTGDAVYVSIDLNMDAQGIPQLMDYNLNTPNPPPDNGPCQTHFDQEPCV